MYSLERIGGISWLKHSHQGSISLLIKHIIKNDTKQNLLILAPNFPSIYKWNANHEEDDYILNRYCKNLIITNEQRKVQCLHLGTCSKYKHS